MSGFGAAWPLVGAAVAGYLVGSVPFGLLLTRLAGVGDIRQVGSGNIGATNVLRTGRKGLAVATLLLDGGKGALTTVAAAALLPAVPVAALVAGGFAVLGHNFPIWLGFKGGKGVATTLGVLLAASWPVGLAACVTWLAVAVLLRYSSLAALVALGLAPFYGWVVDDGAVALLAAGLAVLAVIRHKDNVARLLAGTESRIGRKKNAAEGAGDSA